jgi:hypothetical protein
MSETGETIQRGCWYPSPAPALEGEGDEYTDRLTGADGTGRRPYDHPRGRQCSIGWHMECSRWRGAPGCECPCHEDKAPPDVKHLPASLLDGAQTLAPLYGLPEATGLRVMAMASHAAEGGEDASRAVLAASLETAYGSKQSEDFITDVVNVYHAAVTGRLTS